jgi:hypothetical protein
LALQSNGSTGVTLNTSLNVGIGTASPTARLQIDGTTDATQRIIVGGTGNTSSYKINYNGSEVGFIQNYQNTEFAIGTSVAASLGFNTNNTQRFVITSAGALGIGASPSYGNSGQVLTSGGSGAAPTWSTPSATAGLQSMQVFTSTGTWTKPSGITKVRVRGVGGGGGGGNAPAAFDGAGGGGAGGYFEEIIDVTSVSTVSVTVGAGGAGGAGNSNANNGSTGGTSSFGAYCSATGGSGGFSAATGPYRGGAGGTGSGGNINVEGGGGFSGIANGGRFGDELGGIGGASFFGGSSYNQSSDGGGNSGAAYGSGGCGALSRQGSTHYAGGDGKVGIIIVEEYA